MSVIYNKWNFWKVALIVIGFIGGAFLIAALVNS